MARCKAILVDAYDGSPKLACDVDEAVSHDWHLDKVQNAEWRVPFLDVGITRLVPERPLSADVANAAA